ncbi:YdbC family protein [Bacillus halotolerans]|uniref:YdbC family protein n=1 Tax=Bacillus halotolerans TaxID=260554 RepID=A0ABY7I1T0_9BACI|nr:YdbC family protein [Bacillus halotolerans]MBV5123737.1 YdbC family protein [Bacillus halotolerans]MCC2117415.1 YdbC family protein [Bacillus halotolerans]MDG0767644.1 YdbC family protein [Bacillus halotolerans]WAT21889.1 YdbC family protein [Bacillus halotolerans]
MLIKKIVCGVDAANAEEFSKAQSQWGALSHVSGFIKQAGGWRKTADSLLTAEIIGVWESRAAYDAFMENEHDIIYKEIEQKGTILSIEVTLSQVDAEGAACLLENREIKYEPGWTVTKA